MGYYCGHCGLDFGGDRDMAMAHMPGCRYAQSGMFADFFNEKEAEIRGLTARLAEVQEKLAKAESKLTKVSAKHQKEEL